MQIRYFLKFSLKEVKIRLIIEYKMNILFYYPSNKRTISIESVIIGFKNQGHHVILLTQSEESELHEELRKNSINFSTYVIEKNNALIYYF